MRRRIRFGLITLSLGLVAVGGFASARAVRRSVTDVPPVLAQQPLEQRSTTPGGGTATPPATANSATPTPPPTPVPTIPGGLPLYPDMTQRLWHQPYLELESRLPRYDVTANGITIGPRGDQQGWRSPCDPTTGAPARRGEEVGDILDIAPRWMPAGSERVVEEITRCRLPNGQTVLRHVKVTITVPPDPSTGSKGGYIIISRARSSPPPFYLQNGTIPSERWHPGTIAGRPALVAGPLLPMGLGGSGVEMYSDGVLTGAFAAGVPLLTMQRIMESIFQ